MTRYAILNWDGGGVVYDVPDELELDTEDWREIKKHGQKITDFEWAYNSEL